jgi:hypothetical protein
VPVPRAHHCTDLVVLDSEVGAADRARPPAEPDPGRCRARPSIGQGDCDVAAKHCDVVRMQLLGQQPVGLLISEASFGQDADLHLGGRDLCRPTDLSGRASTLPRTGWAVHQVFGGQHDQPGGASRSSEAGQRHRGLYQSGPLPPRWRCSTDDEGYPRLGSHRL